MGKILDTLNNIFFKLVIMEILEIYFYVLIMGLNLTMGIRCLVDYCKSETRKSYAFNLAGSTLNFGAFLLVLFTSVVPTVF